MEFAPLYKKTSAGKIQTWEIEVIDYPQFNGGQPTEIVTTYGILGGKMQTAVEKIKGGKNIGKANETTPLQQAQAEAQSQWEQKKKAKGYVESIEDAKAGKRDALVLGGVDPMLAHSFEKRGHDIRWPAYVQPKLDGHRCIAVIQNGECTLWSRTRKRITGVPHIAAELLKRYGHLGTLVLDGELYNHDYKDRFEELTSFIKQVTPKPGHEVVQYWVYDLVNESDFQNRALQLADLALGRRDSNTIAEVPIALVDDKDEMIRVFGIYIEAGFEGLMVRNKTGLYVGKRSKDLQFVKLMQDAEYEVVAVEEGKGKMAGLAMFVCKLPDSDKTFRVKMKGKLESLRTYFDNPDPWIGKMLTVQFQKFSADGVPIFPVALRFRIDV